MTLLPVDITSDDYVLLPISLIHYIHMNSSWKNQSYRISCFFGSFGVFVIESNVAAQFGVWFYHTQVSHLMVYDL